MPQPEEEASEPKKEEFKQPGFEVEDKPTPLAGKILLLIMAILTLYLGWQGLNDVNQIPKPPEPLSRCVSPFVNINYKLRPTISRYDYPSAINIPTTNSNNCTFSQVEQKYDIPSLHSLYAQAKLNYDSSQKQVTSLKQQKTKAESDLRSKQRQYDLSLQEDIANRSITSYNPELLQNQIDSLENHISSLSSQINNLTQQANQEKSSFTPQEEALKQAAKKVEQDYNRQLSWYKFKIFFWQLFFTLPAFLIALKLYFKQKAKDSPYTLIFTTLVGVTAILFARITVQYLWTLFLSNLLITLWNIIKNIALLRTLIFYVGMILVIIIFGGAVYLIQKKVFAPDRVRKRRLRKGHCPYCEVPLKFSKNHCPNCGNKIKTQCNSCGKPRYLDFPNCPSCGAKN